MAIKDLITELHDVVSWFQLGIYLDISPSDLMKIRADHREKTDACKTEMLVTWLKQTTDTSWSMVVRALVGIRMGALAQKVAVKYGESHTNREVDTIQDGLPLLQLAHYLLMVRIL